MDLINDDLDAEFGNLRPTVLRMVKATRQEMDREDEAFEQAARQLGVAL